MGAVYSSWPRHISPHQWGCTSCNGMSIGRKATLHAAKALATTGLDLLTEPDLLQAVKDDFVKQLNGRTYKTLNDSEANLLGKLTPTEAHEYDCCIHAAMEHFGLKVHPH